MKALALSSYSVLGGAEISMSTFMDHRPPGWDLRALLVADGPLREQLLGMGIDVDVAPGCASRPRPGHFARFTGALRPVLREYRPDVIWSMGTKSTLLAIPGARLGRVPLVWHKVDFSLDAQLAKPVAAGSSGVIGVSEAVLAALGPLRRSRRLGVVGPPVGLPDDLRADPDPDRPAIGTFARLIPYKGHHHIVEAGALLRREFPGLRIVLAGGPVDEHPGYPDELRALAQRLGVSEHLELPGFVSEVGPLLSQLSVYVNATYLDGAYGLEGLSGAMLEASWAGLPVVASAGGGTGEGVRDGITGTIVERSDPALLADAIAPYLRDPGLARAAGDAGAAFTRERFAPARGAERVFEMLGRAAR